MNNALYDINIRRDNLGSLVPNDILCVLVVFILHIMQVAIFLK